MYFWRLIGNRLGGHTAPDPNDHDWGKTARLQSLFTGVRTRFEPAVIHSSFYRWRYRYGREPYWLFSKIEGYLPEAFFHNTHHYAVLGRDGSNLRQRVLCSVEDKSRAPAVSIFTTTW